VVSLFTNVPVDEVLDVIKDLLTEDQTLAQRCPLQVDGIMELLEMCLRTTYFQVEDKFFQQKDGMAMGNSLSPVVSNIYMEHFEKLALDTTEYKPTKWLRYVDDMFIVWPHGPDKLQEFYHHINNLRPSIQFTMERESNNHLPFLDVLVTKNGSFLSTNVYRKPTHTGRYLHFESNHPHHVKRGVVRSLIHRASIICQDRQDFLNEAKQIKHDLALNGYPSAFVNSIINKPITISHLDTYMTTHGMVVIPYVKGVSEKFRRTHLLDFPYLVQRICQCSLKLQAAVYTVLLNAAVE
jgi:hypothetical protein